MASDHCRPGFFAASILAAMMGSAMAQGNDLNSANYHMPGCRSYMESSSSAKDLFMQGFCVGIIDTIVYASLACPPDRSTLGQWIRVVVQYIDARPARLHESFKKLAEEALIHTWPCKK
jgi:hypothetical protein